MATFYHFTSVDAFERMRKNGDPLQPRRRMVSLRNVWPDFPQKCSDPGVFGLHEQEPQAWHKPRTTPFSLTKKSLLEMVLMDINTNKNFDSKGRGHLYGDMIALLEVMPDDSSDVFVADWGVHFDPEYTGAHSAPYDVRKRVKKAYAESLVPIDDKEKWASHIVPEVICFKPVDQKNIKLVDVWDRFAYINKMRADQGENPIEEWCLRTPGNFRHDVFNQIKEKYRLVK